MDTLSYITSLQDRASSVLRKNLAPPGLTGKLEQAVLYAVHNGGKRIRPVLTYASAETLGGSLENADACACAVELIHAYSLVHDDLPAMDDDDLRRGQPTCHVRFDEATAILAGDALQSLAFEFLAEAPVARADPANGMAMMLTLARAAGWQGMVGGQSLDIEGAGTTMTEADLANMHRLKTGALINASIRLGALSTGNASAEHLESLSIFADRIGLAFQVKDDILDVEGDTAELGKTRGKDEIMNKPTYSSLLGVEGARERMHTLFDEGIEALSGFGDRTDKLTAIAAYIIERKY